MTVDPSPLLSLEDVRFGYLTRPDFLGPITLAVCRGECWAIVGPNGAGKSTLLRLMAGLLKPHAGRVSIGSTELQGLSARNRARDLTFVPQHPPADLDLPVRDVVLMGRFPHRSFGLFESTDDYRIADRAMRITETQEFADRPVATLSGGEAQRVHVAAAIAQEPKVLLLDEPTASLDLQHQQAVFGILRDRALDDGLAVVVVTHDVNLAAQFCSHVLVLHDGKAVATGPPDQVVTPEVLAPVYGVELATFAVSDEPRRRWIVPLEGPGESRT